MKNKTALVFGGSGQDGTFLIALLVSKGYEVYSVSRSNGIPANHAKLNLSNINYIVLDYSQQHRFNEIIKNLKPELVFNLSGESSVSKSFGDIYNSFNSNVNISLYILEAIRNYSESSRLFIACSSESFQPDLKGIIDETSPLNPKSPYATSKACNFLIAREYRKNNGLFISNGILFNHESYLRPSTFVVMKIMHYIVKGDYKSKLQLGNINIIRDWGLAIEYVKAIFTIIIHDKPDDFCICTGKGTSLKELLKIAFELKSLNWEEHVDFDNQLLRPEEHEKIIGNPAKINHDLGWHALSNVYDIVGSIYEKIKL